MGEDYVIIDIGDFLSTLEKRAVRVHPAVLESWYARQYCKSYCIQATGIRQIREDGDHGYTERLKLTIIADRLGIDPMVDLPPPRREWINDGVWILFKDRSLMMGTGRGIEKCWRRLYP